MKRMNEWEKNADINEMYSSDLDFLARGGQQPTHIHVYTSGRWADGAAARARTKTNILLNYVTNSIFMHVSVGLSDIIMVMCCALAQSHKY